MPDQPFPAGDIRNIPADEKLIQQHPELNQGHADPARTPPVSTPGVTHPDGSEAPSSKPSVPLGAPSSGEQLNDSQGNPRPHGQGNSPQERNGVANARRDEQARRTRAADGDAKG